ncbi:hypothetical protein NCS52_01211600 [Fusarium sp. LHS14.1]|nr:hypothetical protein NCS52_01211600 [Fusarium sp. LHS14.1]
MMTFMFSIAWSCQLLQGGQARPVALAKNKRFAALASGHVVAAVLGSTIDAFTAKPPIMTKLSETKKNPGLWHYYPGNKRRIWLEYFSNVYQSDLLLHKPTFLETLAARNVKSHVLLSICAWGANFYHDETGRSILKDQGFMIEWAKKAGKLVFQEAEELHEDNLVTFFNLALFWHSQGSWRVSYLHKGNACQLIHIIGLGPPRSRNAGSEKLFRFDSIADIQTLALPWPEPDFRQGASKAPSSYLNSKGNSRSIFAELIRGLTLWCDVVCAVKTADVGMDSKIAGICTIENKLLAWWGEVQPDFKLDPHDMRGVEQKEFSTILLTNLVYRQSLCALHASIVPLFCWTKVSYRSVTSLARC